MLKWEYATIAWTAKGIFAWPADWFDLDWLRDSFPDAEFEELSVSTYSASSAVPKGMKLLHFSGGDGHAAAMIMLHLGTQGWEAIQITGRLLDRFDIGRSGEGEAWFKRPLPE